MASRLLKTPRALALAAVVAIGYSAPLMASEHGEEDPLTRAELLAATLAGDPSARPALEALFGEVFGDSDAIVALAVELIESLAGDPVAFIDAAILIADVATEILTTQPIVRVSVGHEFFLPPGAFGWDLGSPDSPLFTGFTKLTQGDKGIVAGASGGIQRPGGEGLLSDGLINVSRITLDVNVPDGPYRLILMTDDQGNQSFINPLGKSVTVNGVRTNLFGAAPSGWLGNATLGTPGAQPVSVGTGTGGATVIFVEVVDGKLLIEFEAAGESNILLTGIVLEPANGPSVLTTKEKVFADDEEVLFAEAAINAAIGETLQLIASAAGPGAENANIPEFVEELTDLPEAVSPS